MALPHDLLEQARHLVEREPKKPRQASLRRAISAAYYAIFHLLVSEGAARFASSKPRGLRLQMRRVFSHTDMKDVCRSSAGGNLPIATRKLIEQPIEPDLQFIAERFDQLQEARHEADYDTTASFTRTEALQRVAAAEEAFAAWQRVRNNPNATIFLAALMLQRHWRR
jgi:uncharacterized protein (UPF0332 family)